MEQRKKHIVIFPFMAQGHIIPFLALAYKLEQEKGYTITFVNTPLNIKKLQASISPDSSIQLVEIPFNSIDHGLPPNSENTDILPLHLIIHLIESSASLIPAFRNLISNICGDKNVASPFCIISDMFFPWSANVAHEFGISHAIFNAGGGYGMALLHTIWLNLPHMKLAKNQDHFFLNGFKKSIQFHVSKLPEHLQFLTEPWDFIHGIFQQWSQTDAMLFNTVEEIDQTGLAYFRKKYSCPIWSIGPILPPIGSKVTKKEADNESTITGPTISPLGSKFIKNESENESTLRPCMNWLDSKPQSSVLYIAFGSNSSPSESQTNQLAMALETSEVNFLWAARPPSTFVPTFGDTKNKEWLPSGFEERIQNSKKGLLLKHWAPQMEILQHKSIGAFMSHCGWNSTIEALSNGVPLLAWPMGAEQPFNAKMLEEELKVCVEVANGRTCEVNKEKIVEKIKFVMMEKEGEVMREKACKVKEIFKLSTCDDSKNGVKGSSVKAMDDFLAHAMNAKKELARSTVKWDKCTHSLFYASQYSFSPLGLPLQELAIEAKIAYPQIIGLKSILH